MENFKQKLTRIKTLMFDIDGVLTNGQVLMMENGEVVRNMNSKDGFALQHAAKKGYNIVIISGGRSEAVKAALLRLGASEVFLSQSDKLACYKDYIYTHQIQDDEVLYMGDDLPDYEVMSRAGIACCPADAAPEIKDICIYISGRKGGEGCVRDVVEQVLRSQGNWEISGW
ncbi:MAG: HAD hydrolase family protein [Bacteroidetes bacterium]|nr:HAD hydrolase family protein [Bacteroidota bacterium]